MDQGRIVVRTPLAGDPPDPIAATVRTARGIEAGLSAGARSLSRPPLIHSLPRFGDGLALLLALSLLEMLNPLGLAWLVFALLALTAGGTPHRRLNLRLGDDVPGLAGRLAISFLVIAPFDSRMLSLSRFAWVSAVAIALVVTGRILSYAVIRSARRSGLVRERTLFIGASPAAIELAATIGSHPEFGMTAIGSLTGDGHESVSGAMPVLGEYEALERTVQEFAIRRVIVALDGGATSDLGRALDVCQKLPVDTYVIPPFGASGLLAERAGDDILGIPLVHLRRSPLHGKPPVVKRMLDVTLSGVCLIATAPVFAAATLAVRLSSPGPIFFRQERVGRGGRTFDVFKFRTMYVNDDSDVTWSVLKDNRVTRVGKILRNCSIDELPQLINVMRGDMSLIGPRPERPHFVNRFKAELPNYDRRHRTDGGITGWAQVHGLRGDTSITERVRLDNYYIEHWSLWLDMVIIARTVKEIVRGAIGR